MSGTENTEVYGAHRPLTMPRITTHYMSKGIVGFGYHQTLNATAPPASITWSISDGMLPPGLYLDASTRQIVGTPTESGTFNFTVSAAIAGGSNITKDLSIEISLLRPPAITVPTLPEGIVGVYYEQILGASGTTPITWSFCSGSLPCGLIVDSYGHIRGTPTTAGVFNFTVKAANIGKYDEKSMVIVVTAMPPAISTPSLPTGNVSAGYYQRLNACGTPTPTWSVESGSLPPGLQLYSDGVIFGVPANDGTFNFEVKAENAAGSDVKTFSINISPDESGVSLTGGYIEINGRPYYHSEEVPIDDVPVSIWDDWTQIKFVPDPINATVKSIDWHGSNIIFQGNGAGVQVKNEFESAVDYQGGEISVLVNGDFTVQVTIRSGPDG